MTDLRTAAKQALEALEEAASEMRDLYYLHPVMVRNDAAIVALRAALAQQAEPVTTPIWETLAEIGESAPAGTWDALPAEKL